MPAFPEAIERIDPGALGPESACGRYRCAGLPAVAKRRGMSIAGLDPRNSGDTAGRIVPSCPPRGAVHKEIGRGPSRTLGVMYCHSLEFGKDRHFLKVLGLRRVQSMPVGAAAGRLMRIAWIGVAITLSG